MQSIRDTNISQSEPFLNKHQVALLNKTREAGMTATMLSLWVSPPLNSEVPLPFSAAHGEAVLYFMQTQHYKPSAAIAAVNQLSALEVSLLPLYFPLGLNGDFIIKNRHVYPFHSPYFHSLFSRLIHRHHLPLQQALMELERLSSSETVVLLDLYRQGLRGKDLRRANVEEACQLYESARNNTVMADSTARDAAKYFVKVFRAGRRFKHLTPFGSLLEACSELLKIKGNLQHADKTDFTSMFFVRGSRRINFLLRHVNEGVRADDYPRAFTPVQKKIYSILRLYYSLQLTATLAEMKGLSDDKLAFMCKYYSHGLYHRRIDGFPHHAAFLESFMKRLGWTPSQAIDNLAPLSSDKLVYFHYLQPFGLTLEQVNVLKPETRYTDRRKDYAIFLIKEKDFAPILAVQEAIVASDEMILEAMQDNHLAPVSPRR